MKIAYIGDFINHGTSLAPNGTSIVFLLSAMKEVESIDVFCPFENEHDEAITIPKKIRLIETYSYDKVFSLVKLLNIRHSLYDKVIFNIMPTAFGNSSVSNAIGICVPIILVKLFRLSNIEVVYHNSSFTNDIKKLGYTSVYDLFRSRILKLIEKSIFKNVPTFVLLKLYRERIHSALGNDKVECLNARYLEAVATVFLNEIHERDTIAVERNRSVPNILLHGNWGPQKNIELGIETLNEIRKDGISFNLIITGGINHHFPEYEKHFRDVLNQYDFASSYKGSVTEKEIFTIFTNSDILLLPYNTPGGHSGVLEQAIFFEIPTIAIDFQEYREQCKGISNVEFVSSNKEFYKSVYCFLLNWNQFQSGINISGKIEETKRNLEKLIGESYHDV